MPRSLCWLVYFQNAGTETPERLLALPTRPGVWEGKGQIGGHMDAARQYEQLALDCLNLAGATRDSATQDQMMRLAEFCARLADDAEDKVSSPRADHLPR
jgi:hypothetical protein